MTFVRRTLAVFVLSLLLFQASAVAFDDVATDSPYYYGVEYLRQQEVIPSRKWFRPEIEISKADFIQILVRVNLPAGERKLKAGGIKLPYTDTSDVAWYAPYFQKAIDLGILKNEAKKIVPYKKINVPEALELLFRSKKLPIPRATKVELPYEDVRKNKNALPLMVRALEMNLIKPKTSTFFGIYRKVNRGEATRMVYRMQVATADQTAVVSLSDQKQSSHLDKFIQAWELVHKNFHDQSKVEDETMIDAAIKAMVNALGDPYSTYLNKEENKSVSDSLNGQVEGIGAYVAIEKDRIVIVSPIKDSPAYRAGVKAGDVIVAVDGTSTEGMTLEETVRRIKGKKGTTVQLKLLRNDSTLTLSIVRDIVDIKAVELDYAEGDIAHLKLIQFSKRSAREFREAVQVITANPEIKGVILDVRDNPGGFLDSVIEILGHILPTQSVAVNVKYSQVKFTQFTTGKGELSHYPLVVLINKGSASASEIVAGGIKDLKLGTLVGEKTFGKGSVQELNFFSDQSSLKLTVAQWLTSLGSSIEGKGVEPDIVVQSNGSGTDLQLQRATQEIRKLIQ